MVDSRVTHAIQELARIREDWFYSKWDKNYSGGPPSIATIGKAEDFLNQCIQQGMILPILMQSLHFDGIQMIWEKSVLRGPALPSGTCSVSVFITGDTITINYVSSEFVNTISFEEDTSVLLDRIFAQLLPDIAQT